GMVPVAALAASAAGGPNARITATGSASGQSRQPVEATIGRAIFDRNVTTFDIASLLQALPNGAEHSIIELSAGKQADQRHAGLLRPRRERPRGRAAEQRDEIASVHCAIPPVRSTERIAHLSYGRRLLRCRISIRPMSGSQAAVRVGPA